jgi:hypothetical protein
VTTTEGDKRGQDVISRDVMGSEPEVGDKRSALDAPDTDDDYGCAEQSDTVGTEGPKSEQSGTRNKKLRRGEGAPRGASGGKILNDKRQNETKHKQEGVQVKGKGKAVEKRKSLLSEKADTARKTQCGKGVGVEGGRRMRCEEEAYKVSTQPQKTQVQGMCRGEHMQAVLANTTSKEASASNAVGRASASTTT